MGFVVEEFPFREKIVSRRTDSKVGVAKGFDTRTKEGIFKTKINSSLPDDTTDIKGVRATNTDTSLSLSNDVLGFLRQTFNFQRFDLGSKREIVDIWFSFRPERTAKIKTLRYLRWIRSPRSADEEEGKKEKD